jgi:hypothetical protein
MYAEFRKKDCVVIAGAVAVRDDEHKLRASSLYTPSFDFAGCTIIVDIVRGTSRRRHVRFLHLRWNTLRRSMWRLALL